MGLNRNSVATAEDVSGNLKFYALTPEIYLGKSNDNCLVFEMEAC